MPVMYTGKGGVLLYLENIHKDTTGKDWTTKEHIAAAKDLKDGMYRISSSEVDPIKYMGFHTEEDDGWYCIEWSKDKYHIYQVCGGFAAAAYMLDIEVDVFNRIINGDMPGEEFFKMIDEQK